MVLFCLRIFLCYSEIMIQNGGWLMDCKEQEIGL